MQHSNHRTAALIASKPARIITSAALAVALTATPMLSPVWVRERSDRAM